MGPIHSVQLADLEMGPHQHSCTFQDISEQDPQVEEAACRALILLSMAAAITPDLWEDKKWILGRKL